jgi:hypothetical protein
MSALDADADLFVDRSNTVIMYSDEKKKQINSKLTLCYEKTYYYQCGNGKITH